MNRTEFKELLQWMGYDGIAMWIVIFGATLGIIIVLAIEVIN